VTRLLSYVAGAIAPHVTTQRWTYTVPAGKKAFVELAFCQVFRTGVAGTLGMCVAYVQVTPQGGSATVMLGAKMWNNTAGAQDTVEIGLAWHMKAGDQIEGITQDGSVGGTIDYQLTAKITEFDA